MESIALRASAGIYSMCCVKTRRNASGVLSMCAHATPIRLSACARARHTHARAHTHTNSSLRARRAPRAQRSAHISQRTTRTRTRIRPRRDQHRGTTYTRRPQASVVFIAVVIGVLAGFSVRATVGQYETPHPEHAATQSHAHFGDGYSGARCV